MNRLLALAVAGVIALPTGAASAAPEGAAGNPGEAVSVGARAKAAGVEAKAKPVRNASLRYLGEAIPFTKDLYEDGEDRGLGFADPIVGRLGDGTYIMLVLRGTPDRPYVAFRSRDLKSWEKYAEYGCTVTTFVDGPCQGRMIGFQSLEDGRLRVFFLVYGPQVIRSAVTSDGVTWEQEWDVKLRLQDFPDMESLEFAYVAQMPDRSWRLYITALDCDVLNLRGRPNCADSAPDPDPSAPSPAARLAHTYISASSPDGVTWAPDPGVRWQASKQNGSLQRIAARTTPSGKVQIISNDTSMHALTRTSLITLESDDGLDFRKVSDQQVEIADPHFVTDPRGRTVIFSSNGNPDHFGGEVGVRMWEPAQVTWVVEDARVDDLVYDSNAGFEQGCFTIRVRGTGQLKVGVTGFAQWDKPRSADRRLYRLSTTAIKAPGIIRVKVKQLDQSKPENVGRPDFPRNVTVTDTRTGVIRVIPMYWHGLQNRAAPTCEFRR